MNLRWGCALWIACSMMGCGSGTGGTSTTSLRIEAGDPVTLSPGESALLRVVVLGPGGESASISSPDLPAFAQLSGATLRLSPQRTDLGEYTVTLLARAGGQSATTQVSVAIQRANTAPQLAYTQILEGAR